MDEEDGDIEYNGIAYHCLLLAHITHTLNTLRDRAMLIWRLLRNSHGAVREDGYRHYLSRNVTISYGQSTRGVMPLREKRQYQHYITPRRLVITRQLAVITAGSGASARASEDYTTAVLSSGDDGYSRALLA